MADVILAPDHKGMMVDYQGLLRQSRAALGRESANAEMLRQLTNHLTELGARYYAGDVAVVDEFLQLYCVNKAGREAVKEAQRADPT